MAYVGTPIDTRNQFQSLQGKRFNGDGSTTAFTLDVAPGNVLDIEVFVGNVRQDPNSAYTLSGTTLTFTGAPPSGTNNIYVVHQAKAVGTIDVPTGGVQPGSLASNVISGQTLVTLDNSADHVLINDATDGALKKALIPAASFAGIDDQSSSNDDQLTITDTAVVINEDSDDVDFRVESNGDADCLVVNAGDDKVGIGTNGPLGKLHIKTGAQAGTPNVDTNADELVLESSGNGGLNILTPQANKGTIAWSDDGDADVGVIEYVHSDNSMRFTVNATEHFRIASNGTLTATDTSIGSNSDLRIKENIANFTYDLTKFKQLQPKTFDWKNPSQHNGVGGNRGFIAQEVKAIDDYWTGEILVEKDHADYNLLDSVIKNNCVINDEMIFASGISKSDWEAGKLDNTYPKNSIWKASVEDNRISLTSKLGNKDAMYISVINQLITKIETLETEMTALKARVTTLEG